VTVVPLTSGEDASPKLIVTAPFEPVLTETCARLERSSTRLSRWSSRALGDWPAWVACVICALSVAICWASCWTWPLVPVRVAYCWPAWVCTVCIWAETALKVEARVWPASTTACCAAGLVGAAPRDDHALQNLLITFCRPSLEGSSIAVCTWASWEALVLALLVAVFCARYWTSRN
jgi:hypothetical protein